MNKHGVSRRSFSEADIKHFKSGALRTITNITRSIYSKLKKRIPSQVISKILFTDTEQLSKMKISLQVFFKDFVNRFGSISFKNEFL